MSAKRKLLVTQALPYANGSPHLGHLVGMIQTDIWVRLYKMLGNDCLFVCGSDVHGTPIMIQAEKRGQTPEDMIREVHNEQLRDFGDFHIEFDNYHTTHSDTNRTLVELVFKRQLDAGNISKRVIKQFYDPVKNMFLPDRYIKGECPKCGAKDQYGDNCEVCSATYLPTELKDPYSAISGAKPVEKESEHYFFKLQNFENFLKDWTHGNHLQEQVTNKLSEWFKEGLKEWDISRDAPYFGFKIPGEDHKYFYVWLDAPVGYIASFKDLCDKRPDLNFDDYWRDDSNIELYHFIGKDIIYFHALFWPALLKGAKLRTPTKIFVNGYLTIDNQKMSKSRGTFIKARTYLNHLRPEFLRYYLAAKLSDRIEDLDINFDDFTQRVNSDLVGKYINIASRCAPFLKTHFNNQLSSDLDDESLFHDFSKAGDEIKEKLLALEYSQALRQIMSLADRANEYIDAKKPWKLAKEAGKEKDVQAVCTMGINLFRLLTIYLKPILPIIAKQVEAFLMIKPLTWDDKNHALLNHSINDYNAIINRIDPKQIEAMKMASKEDIVATPQPTTQNSYISIDDFSKIDLRVAKMIEADHVEGADKLLRLKVDLGDNTRQIFAGIKSAYDPASLVGAHVVVVANLEPRKMRFGLSEGMVLAAGPGGKDLFVVRPDNGATAGMKVK